MHPEVPEDIHFDRQVADDLHGLSLIARSMRERLKQPTESMPSVAREVLSSQSPNLVGPAYLRLAHQEFRARSIGMLHSNYVFDDGSVLMVPGGGQLPTASGPEIIDREGVFYIHEVTRRHNAARLPKKDVISTWIARILNKDQALKSEVHARPRSRV